MNFTAEIIPSFSDSASILVLLGGSVVYAYTDMITTMMSLLTVFPDGNGLIKSISIHAEGSLLTLDSAIDELLKVLELQ